MTPLIPRLLLVTNRRNAVLPLPELAARAIAGGVDLVEIREKDLPSDELGALVGAVLAAVNDPSRLMVNGAPEIAELFGIGLHLPAARRMEQVLARSGTPISRSIHDVEGARRLGDACAFAVAGHVYATGSKPGLPPIGLDGLAAIVAASRVPIVAIGGITADRARAVIEAGAAGVAVMSAINDSPEPEAAGREIRRALENESCRNARSRASS